ncbi:hypothetical protein L9F63_023106, partial [Diploptera punctata]
LLVIFYFNLESLFSKHLQKKSVLYCKLLRFRDHNETLLLPSVVGPMNLWI